MASVTHFASVMQQVNKQWLFMIKVSSRFAHDLKKQLIVTYLFLTKILFQGLSVITGYQYCFKSENVFWCFGKFQLLSAVSLLTGLSGFPRGSYLQAAAVTEWAAKQVQWDYSAAWEWRPGWVSSLLSPFKACRLWPVNGCLNKVWSVTQICLSKSGNAPYYLAYQQSRHIFREVLV